MENMNNTQSQKKTGCPCMDMNKKYAEGFDYDKIKKSAKASSKTDELANSEDELDILEVEEDEFE